MSLDWRPLPDAFKSWIGLDPPRGAGIDEGAARLRNDAVPCQARRMDFRLSQTPTTQMGILGFCTGRGSMTMLSTRKCSPEKLYGFPFHSPAMI